MSGRIQRSKQVSIRVGLTSEELWDGPDRGLFLCWETGRLEAIRQPELAERAKRDELPTLIWKGGIEKKLKAKLRYGTLQYLATWQGLRGDDLDIDILEEIPKTCSRSGQCVVFTADQSKYAECSNE
jgi:hypothetical protein